MASAVAFCFGDSAVLRSANEEPDALRKSLRSLASADRHGPPTLFKTWDEVPDHPTAAHKLQPWFLEVFAGKAWLTRAMRKAGWSTLPPVEINVEGDTLASADLLDPALRKKIDTWIASGCVRLAHFGAPCTTFSRARKKTMVVHRRFVQTSSFQGFHPSPRTIRKRCGWALCSWTSHSSSVPL